jgi:hypothetical protein
LLNWFLDPGAQLCFLERNEELLFGGLEVVSRLLGLAVERQIQVQDLLLAAAAVVVRVVKVFADRVDPAGTEQAQPTLEEGALGEARRKTFFLKRDKKEIIIREIFRLLLLPIFLIMTNF